jgi:hypothetical protein
LSHFVLPVVEKWAESDEVKDKGAELDAPLPKAADDGKRLD